MIRPIWLLLLLPLPAAAAEPGFGPFSSPRHPVTQDAVAKRPTAYRPSPDPAPSTFLYLSYEFYRRALSPIDGPRCVHRPTCSRYALIAVQRHPVLGLMLAVDRLWRGSDNSALRLLPSWRQGEHFGLLDPLEESDFWLRPPRP
ncbi:MAG: membrane protein insertion efficiency factor YidD [Myxococcota bacterium]|nr:membrane protein insertion efficiency factor YidD [Myxococcota bacterium]